VAEERLVLSDSSPLIALDAAGGFELVRELFGRIAVTALVRDEVLAGGERAGALALSKALAERWIGIQPVPARAPQFPALGPGEASTLAAALGASRKAYLLLDEERARREADARGLEFTGTLGVLIVAKRRRLISGLRPYLARLVQHGFHLTPELGRALLKEAGEE
jgi:predicted nucleic acid-binding protein